MHFTLDLSIVHKMCDIIRINYPKYIVKLGLSKTNIGILIFLLLAAIVSFYIGEKFVIAGLDNTSLYFRPFDIPFLFQDETLALNLGAVFASAIFMPLRLIFSPGASIFFFLVNSIALGGYSIYRLIDSNVEKASVSLKIVTSLFYITALWGIWTIAHPNLIFIAAFGAVPSLIYLLGLKNASRSNWLELVFSSALLLITIYNPAAFILYLLQILALSAVIKGEHFKRVFIKWLEWILVLGAVVLLVFTLVNSLNGGERNIFESYLSGYSSVLNDPVTAQSTEGTLESEKFNNLFDSIRFAVGWMELHDVDSKPVLDSYDFYKYSPIAMAIGSLPFIIVLVHLVRSALKNSLSKKDLLLMVTMSVGLFMVSKYFILLIEQTEVLKVALRWTSSKVWMLYGISLTLLLAKALADVSSKQKMTLLIAAILIAIYISPFLLSGILPSQVRSEIPSEYFQIDQKLNSNQKVLILPEPQKLYMRQYDWGYYGSDFISYASGVETVDASGPYNNKEQYFEVSENLKKCMLPEDINFILYDKTLYKYDYTNDPLLECLEGSKKVESNSYFDIYQLRPIR